MNASNFFSKRVILNINELFKAVHYITFINLMNLANIFCELLNQSSLNSSSDLHTILYWLLLLSHAWRVSSYTPSSTRKLFCGVGSVWWYSSLGSKIAQHDAKLSPIHIWMVGIWRESDRCGIHYWIPISIR